MTCYRISTDNVFWFLLAPDLQAAVSKAKARAMKLGLSVESIKVQDYCSTDLTSVFPWAWRGLNETDRIEVLAEETARQSRDVKRLTEYKQVIDLMS